MIAEILKIFRRRCSIDPEGYRIITEGHWWDIAREIYDLLEEDHQIPFEAFVKYEVRSHPLSRCKMPIFLKKLLGKRLHHKAKRKYRRYVNP